MVWRLISSVYRAGYNEVKISFEDKSFRDVYTAFTYNTIQVLKDGDEEQLSPLEAIQSLVNRFIGFEIIEQKTHYCIIKDLGNTNPKEFDNTLRRIFLLLQTMSEAVLTNLKEGKKEELKGVHIIDTNIDRFEDFCLRVLNKEGYSDFKKTSAMYSLIFVLEMVGDEFKKLGLHLLNFKKPKNKNIIKFATYSDNMLRTFYDLYYNFSNEKAEQVYKIDKDYADLFEKVYSDLAPEESELLHHLKKINIFMLSLTELRIDMAY
jgi:phosphate uptake regulator